MDFPSSPDPDCPFCAIATAYPPTSPINGTFTTTKDTTDLLSSELAYIILSTPDVLCFLDHMPISPGHVLLIPRHHRAKLANVTVRESAVLGAWLPILSRAVMKAVGALAGVEEVADWNVVQNNGARAAQVVFHSHFHIIPRPASLQEIKARSWTMFGKGQRGDLDEDEAVTIRDRVRAEIRELVMALTGAERRVLGVEEGGSKL